MNPYTKAALFLIRMIAFGLILCSALLLGSYLFYVKFGKKPNDGIFALILKTFPLFIGLGLLFKSSAIAKKLTDQFDE